MWALGRYDLGLTDREFWALTPRQFSALVERKRVGDDFLAALSALTPFIVSSALATKNKKPRFDDFVLTRGKR